MSDENSYTEYQDRQKQILRAIKALDMMIDATEEQYKLDLENPEERGKSTEELIEDSKRIQEMKDEANKTKQFLTEMDNSYEALFNENEE